MLSFIYILLIGLLASASLYSLSIVIILLTSGMRSGDWGLDSNLFEAAGALTAIIALGILLCYGLGYLILHHSWH